MRLRVEDPLIQGYGVVIDEEQVEVLQPAERVSIAAVERVVVNTYVSARK